MKRATLEAMGLEKEQIDQILDENSADIGRERAKADAKQEKSAHWKANFTRRTQRLKHSKSRPRGLASQAD